MRRLFEHEPVLSPNSKLLNLFFMMCPSVEWMCVLRGRCEDVRGYGLGKTVLSEAAGAEASFEAVRWTATKLSGAPIGAHFLKE